MLFLKIESIWLLLALRSHWWEVLWISSASALS